MKQNFDFEKQLTKSREELEDLRRKLAGKPNERLAAQVSDMERKIEQLANSIYSNLNPWQRVQIARHTQRPYLLDYARLCFDDFVELHGDRHFGDDNAMPGGLATLDGRRVMLIGHQKGRDTRENLLRNFGSAHPEGYRKALRLMRLAEKFSLPVVALIDTPGAFPGIGAEERNIAEAIAFNLREMMTLATPMISVVIGEGGSGGALGIGVTDRVLMLENSYYSVISPEGCAAILWKHRQHAPEAAQALKLSATDLQELGIVDGIIPEPLGGAHHDHHASADALKAALVEALDVLCQIPKQQLLEARYAKFRAFGKFTVAGRSRCSLRCRDMEQRLRVDFRHGVGDSSHFAHLIPLYQRRGYKVTVGCNSDRVPLFKATGAEVTLEMGPEVVLWTQPPVIDDAYFVHPAQYNKAAFNISLHPLPYIGRQEDLWEELVASEVSLLSQIEAADWDMVRSFTDRLPRPLILLHTVGFSFRKDKSLPDGPTLELYQHLLEGCDGTLLLLDWDDKAPRLPSPRILHLTDHWRKLRIAQLAALLVVSDLLIGVDSGPLHLARMTNTPALGICLHHFHHPARYCLPRPGHAFVVPSGFHPRTNRITRGAFNIIEEDNPSAEIMAKHALRLLQRPRYLRSSQRGADLLMRSWVQDKGRPITSDCQVERAGDNALDHLLLEASRRFPWPRMVEVGSFRGQRDGAEESYSTVVLAAFAHRSGGSLLSLQPDAAQFKRAQNSCRLLHSVSVETGDSVEALARLTDPIDVLSLAASGAPSFGGDTRMLEEVRAADHRLHRDSLILIDETPDHQSQGAVGTYDIIHWLKQRGWHVIASGAQTLLARCFEVDG